MVQASSSRSILDDEYPINLIRSQHEFDALAQLFVKELIDDAILNVVFEVHRSFKRGLLFLEMGSPDEEEEFLQVTTEGLDVFGQAPAKKQLECMCPNCSRNLAASRFAPHLEKCMGMGRKGRNSSRIASRRIQNNSSENNIIHVFGSDDDDEDWTAEKKRKKRDKNSPRRNKKDKKVVAAQVSSLIMDRKMNTRSIRPLLSNDHKKGVQDQFSGLEGDYVDGSVRGNNNGRHEESSNSVLSRTGILENDELPVDIDGLDEAQIISSWENDHSDTTSPADSTSTNNSTSSSLLRRSSKTKKSSKSSKSSNSSHGSVLD